MPRVTSPTTRFTAAEFERMAEADVFGEHRVELINGIIYWRTSGRRVGQGDAYRYKNRFPRATSRDIRFTAVEYQRMADAGLFDDRRVELINGRIYGVAPQNNSHMIALSNVNRALVPLVPRNEWLVVQGTLRLDKNSTVDPDFAWYPRRAIKSEDPTGLPILIIEVSDSSYRLDTGIKLRKYAKAGVRDYWIVNVREARVEVHRDPQSTTGKLADFGYRDVKHYSRDEKIALLDRPDVSFRADDLLP